MGENQDRTHEATHNANTIACSAGGGGGGGSRPQLGVCSAVNSQHSQQQQQAQRR
jgi:hypothetical protein